MAGPWNIVVCGDLSEEAFVVQVSDPKIQTIAHIKKQIEKIMQIPSCELNLYQNERKLTDDKVLKDSEGLGNGVAVCAILKPIVLTVLRADCGVSVEIKIPRQEFPKWTVSILKEIVCFKFLMDPDSPHVLASAGHKLEKHKNLCEFVRNESIVTLTPLKHVKMINPPSVSGKTTVILPASCSLTRASQSFLYSRDLFPVTRKEHNIDFEIFAEEPNWLGKWSVSVVQQFPCTKIELVISNPRYTTVQSLRSKIQAELSIPTHQQKLLVGDIVLEEWDEDGKIMLLANYPTLFAGATISVVKLTDGIQMKHDVAKSNCHSRSIESLKLEVSEQNAVDTPTHINVSPFLWNVSNICYCIDVHCTQEITIEKIYRIMENIGGCKIEKLYLDGMFITRSSATLDSLKPKTECTLSRTPKLSKSYVYD